MLILGFVMAFLTSLFLTPLVIKLAIRNGWVDIPQEFRSMHRKAMPRAGGLAVVAAFGVGTGFLYLLETAGMHTMITDMPINGIAFALGCLIIAFIGLYDDAFDLGFKSKFMIQLIVAYIMFLFGFRISLAEFELLPPDPYLQVGIELPLTLLWYLAIMNGTNLIDGLDGLASGISIIAFVFLAIVFGINGNLALLPILLVSIGAILGFIIYNFKPASIFLGDTGSLFLGFLLATTSLAGSGHSNPWLAIAIPTLVIGLPLIEPALSLIRRVLNGTSPFAPDKDHIHHRLSRQKHISITGAVIRLYVFNAVLGLFAVSIALTNEYYSIPLLVGASIFVCTVLKKLGYLDRNRMTRLVKLRLRVRPGEFTPRGKQPRDLPESNQSIPENAHLDSYSASSLREKNIPEKAIE